MTTSLHTLKNNKPKDRQQRVGRGPGSGRGKTSGRGHKGQGARSGAKKRYGNEGGQFPLYMKLPTRGFSRARFREELHIVNLWQIEKFYDDAEDVNEESLRKHGLVSGKCHGIKVLANGEITKKVTMTVNAISAGAQKKLEDAGITFSVI
ncbi:MAG: 50S ribosomal protein L15 [Waddliaceae bacterium]|jgi:large subunit ribosomal protein L15|nr:50S ribosomal protein L15 [Waddliaceae bacterium]MBT3578643.1 50S ribosomal protein L15 [Waddliaceae bacterium]MBT4445362.1 50S ribosomal protein L15 [Waddliaceae bacterium]MBT6928370.1 50S ribosomal protein L15 [Waddliaceae bacterium]MBT7265056.1 50S ribosomal protein L15 [Waddliaceae bacterium]